MLKKNTKWVILVLVALTMYSIYLTVAPAEVLPTPTLPPPPDFLFEVNPLDIQGITIVDAEGVRVSFEVGEDDIWHITEPEEYPFERLDTQRFFQGVSGLVGWTSLTDASDITALNTVGLTEPGYQVIIYVDDAPDIEIWIGDQTITGNGYYVLVDNGFPQVVSLSAVDGLIILHSELPLLPEPTATLDLTGEPVDPESTLTDDAKLTETPAEDAPAGTLEPTETE